MNEGGSNDFSPLGLDLFGEPMKAEGQGPLANKFLVPPFSVLSAREGAWQERKNAWLSLGIESEVGRAGNLLGFSDAVNKGGYGEQEKKASESAGTSVFDPVLAEVAYRWWSPPGGMVVDPFAGGSVRGIIAEKLGRRYWGSELRSEQVTANWEQARKICPDARWQDLHWERGDSRYTMVEAPQAAFLFTCPPYGNLEVYSDDPADLSTMEWPTFCSEYYQILEKSCERLKNNRFAAIVVGDFRSKEGWCRDFVSQTIGSFRGAGLELYNEAILVTPVGTCAMRGARIFEGGRKLTKAHQNLLVFCKGDWKKAHQNICRCEEEGGAK